MKELIIEFVTVHAKQIVLILIALVLIRAMLGKRDS